MNHTRRWGCWKFITGPWHGERTTWTEGMCWQAGFLSVFTSLWSSVKVSEHVRENKASALCNLELWVLRMRFGRSLHGRCVIHDRGSRIHRYVGNRRVKRDVVVFYDGVVSMYSGRLYSTHLPGKTGM